MSKGQTIYTLWLILVEAEIEIIHGIAQFSMVVVEELKVEDDDDGGDWKC
ncbi:uncharacterized protein G2W53_036646 [Senna tora]|uniref:Uncharacterized protein n=1 Tax=Senna tora TaxID=362788 RepID=A0A834ST15_9FABA|nr:uncharacterized protein G2W53_036646 [Senna tora]